MCDLIDLRSNQGEQLLEDSDALEAFIPLSVNFVTQKNQAFCGVASIVMVLNALQLPAPAVPEYDPYHTFTQDNFLNEQTEAILPREALAKQGMTLDQIGGLLGTQPVEVEIHHAADVTLDAFRSTAREYLGREGHGRHLYFEGLLREWRERVEAENKRVTTSPLVHGVLRTNSANASWSRAVVAVTIVTAMPAFPAP